MIEHFVDKHSLELPDQTAEEIRDNIYFDSLADQETQLHIFNYQLPILINDSFLPEDEQESQQDMELNSNSSDSGRDVRRKKPIKLIIIDSITNNFRSDLGAPSSTDPPGHQGQGPSFKSSILQRSADLCEIGLRMRSLADQYGIAVICVNQVTDVFQPELGFLSSTNSDLPSRQQDASLLQPLSDPMRLKKPALGLVWENTINARVILQRTRAQEPSSELSESESSTEAVPPEPIRTLSVIFSPWAANDRGSEPRNSGHCQYKIIDSGVVGCPPS